MATELQMREVIFWSDVLVAVAISKMPFKSKGRDPRNKINQLFVKSNMKVQILLAAKHYFLES